MAGSRLLWRLLLPIPPVLALAMLAAVLLVPRHITENAYRDAIAAANQTVFQFKALRKYYTDHVISKALASGALVPTITHDGANEIPLPATMVHEMSDILADQEVSIRLYSAFPFPNRGDRALDAFQSEAWDYLTANPDGNFVRQQTIDGRRHVRVAIADRLVADACVACHNSHPQSPKTDWRLGQVRGVLEVAQDIDAQIARGTALAYRSLFGLLLAGILIAFILVVLVRRLALLPLSDLTVAAGRMAEGDLSVRARAGTTAELAQLANTFNRMADTLEQKAQREAHHVERLRAAADIENEVERLCRHVAVVAEGDLTSRIDVPEHPDLADLARRLNAMTERLATSNRNILTAAQRMTESVDNVETALDSQSNLSAHQATMADRSSEILDRLSESSRDTSALAEKLGASAEQTLQQGALGLQSVDAAMGAARAMRTESEEMAQTISSLTTQTQEIGKITDTVATLAQQSKILAFNASIEAAKAGEAGKGFSVVSAEVRVLAEQSERATQDVRQLLDTILNATNRAVLAVERGSKSVDHTIALVEQTGEAMQRLREAIKLASTSSDAIVSAVRSEASELAGVQSEIDGFNVSTRKMLDAGNHALEAVADLREVADQLRARASVYRL